MRQASTDSGNVADIRAECYGCRLRKSTATALPRDWHGLRYGALCTCPGPSPLTIIPLLALAALLLLSLAAVAVLWWRRRQNGHMRRLRRLLDLADALEADLKTCRIGLAQAHAVMSANPDAPAASEQDAQRAVDAGLRALLQQRLWIRDRSAQASARELDAAASAMDHVRDRLRPLLLALAQAQHALDSAMREHIRQDGEA